MVFHPSSAVNKNMWFCLIRTRSPSQTSCFYSVVSLPIPTRKSVHFWSHVTEPVSSLGQSPVSHCFLHGVICQLVWNHSPPWVGLASSSIVKFILSLGLYISKLTFALDLFLMMTLFYSCDLFFCFTQTVLKHVALPCFLKVDGKT